MRPSRLFVITLVALTLLATAAGVFGQTVTTLYSFPRKGGQPQDLALVQGRDGQLYGTTLVGGTNGEGTVFKISTAGVVRFVYSFDLTSGATPEGGLTLATDGSFYGATVYGGSATPPYGVIFKLSPNGSEQVLVNFTESTGGSISAPVEVSNGDFYGGTDGPGTGPSVGNLYQFTESGAFTVLDTFGGSLGNYPNGKLAQGTNSRLYGIAELGGADECGTIYEVTLSGLPVSIYNFDCTTGDNPVVGLILASDGNFYGTTDEGGTHGLGIVYRFSQNGVLTVLYNFGDTAFDSYPQSVLLQTTDGNLYGTTGRGGVYGIGTIFQVTLGGVYTRVYDFPGNGGPQYTYAGLAQHTNGTIYGESDGGGSAGTGTIFSLDMGLGPFITFVLPTGRVGQTAQILGQGLTGTTSVTFNGVPATSFNVATDTFMTAVVPSGATTGKVVVTTPSGPLTSNVIFRIIN
jgi:uncharacterized repeat protein (TIGR03803 family)